MRILSRNCKKNCKNSILATILTNNIFLLILLISSARRGKTAIRWAYRGFQELLACRGLSRTLERGGPTDDAWTRFCHEILSTVRQKFRARRPDRRCVDPKRVLGLPVWCRSRGMHRQHFSMAWNPKAGHWCHPRESATF